MGVYFPDDDSFTYFHEETITETVVLSLLRDYIPIFHNSLFDMWVLRKHFDVHIRNFEDTMIMSYLDYPDRDGGHSLKNWGDYLGSPKLEAPSFDTFSEELIPYCEQDCRLTWMVFEHLKRPLFGLDEILINTYNKSKQYVNEVLIGLNHNGVQIDLDKWDEVIQEVSQERQEVLDKIHEIVPQAPGQKSVTRNPKATYGDMMGEWILVKFDEEKSEYHSQKWEVYNPGSIQQTAWALKQLYPNILIPVTAKGNLSVDTAFLDSHRDLPLVELLLEYSRLQKLHSTYGESLKEQVRDGRLYADFNHCVTLTGRLSSSKPNLQNIPARGEKGSRIRELFIAPKGHKLVGIDFDSFQMRILAWYLHEYCPEYPDAHILYDEFNSNLEADPHAITASIIFGDNFTKEERSIAKTFNFGQLFGFGVKKASAQCKIPLKEAQRVKSLLEEKYPSLSALKERVWQECLDNEGYVYTAYGRRGFYPNILSDDRGELSRAQRQVFNFIIQGTEADIVNEVLISSNYLLTDRNLTARLVLQVHDEVIYEAKEQEAEATAQVLNESVNNDWLPGLKITGTATIGNNWRETK